MKIELDIRKTIEENAARYFEESKKAKGKIDAVRAIIEKSKLELERLEEKELEVEKKEVVEKREKKWFEKFRWFISSEGFLCIGGRDATSNEIVIKKHTDPSDIVFHTEMSGSPFFVVKSEGKPIGEITLNEVGIATASFSRAWKQGIGYLDVFYVNPDQVSKEAKSGEYIAKGAFMIYGKKNIIRAEPGLAIGKTEEGMWMCGPRGAVHALCKEYYIVRQGKDRPSDIAKMLVKKHGGDSDEIIRCMPAGTSRVSKATN